MIRLSTGRIFWGIVLTALGVIWMMKNFGYATPDVGELLRLYWPLIPLYFCLASLFEIVVKRGFGNRGILWGSLIINGLFTAIFVIALGNIHYWWEIDLSNIWKLFFPAVLLLIGVMMLTGGVNRPGSRTYWAIMSGAKETRSTWDDLSIINIMGGSNIDMSQAGLPDKEILIDVYSIMGGGDLRLPAGVKVVCTTTSVMGGTKVFGRDTGGFVDARVIEAGDGPVVRVRSLSVMGGFTIKQDRWTETA